MLVFQKLSQLFKKLTKKDINMINKIKSKMLTYLFKDWVANEYDLETLELTKGMINNREVLLKTIIDKVNHKPIIGFKQKR